MTAAEGLIWGTGAKMFSIAGPVLVYGIVASVVYGFVYWLMQMIEQTNISKTAQGFLHTLQHRR